MTGIWGEAVGTFELAPLRRQDVFAALDAHGISVEGFMRALLAAQAVPFAIKPLTLKMLLAIYRQRGDLPNSNIDLYKQGCLALCEEQNKSRRNSGPPRKSQRGPAHAPRRPDRRGHDPRQPLCRLDRTGGRMPVSKTFRYPRLRATVKTAPSPPSPRPMTMSAKCSIPDCSARAATTAWVGPTRATANFSPRSISSSEAFPPETMLKTLLHPAGGLIPQLSGVAAWAASLSGALRATLIADEPFALLKGDLSSWSDDDRTSLVKSLLDAVESKRVTNSPYSNAEAYAKLNHPGLAAELRPFITDGHLSVTTRRFALVIAEKCRLTELQPELLQVALDEGDNPYVRAGAVSALKHCGDASVPPLIRPLGGRPSRTRSQ